MTRWAIFVVVFLLGGMTSANAQQDTSATSQELIVRLRGSAPQTLQQTLSDWRTYGSAQQSGDQASLYRGITDARPVFTRRISGRALASRTRIRAFTLTVADSVALDSVQARWAAREDVQYVQPNITYRLESAADTLPGLPSDNVLSDSLDHLEVIRATEAWSKTIGTGVRIGVLDTGLYLDHPDLRDQLWINAAEDLNGNGRLDADDLNGVDDDGNGVIDDVVGYDFVDRPGLPFEGEYTDRDPDPSADLSGGFSFHGTLVAGVVAARPRTGVLNGVYGVAPGASIVPLRAFAGDGRGQTDDIAAAIVYAADQGVDILNLSFGRDLPSPLLDEAIQYATDRGTLVVASAGNNSTDEPHYPSDYPDVVSVLWLAEDGQGLPTFSRSQFGIGVDIGAPGSRVYTTRFPQSALRNDETLDLDALYGNASGSSFAAPQVAGVAALLRALEPTLSPQSLQSILTGTAADVQAPGWDHQTGAGRLDAVAALSNALPARTEIITPDHNAGTASDSTVAIRGTALNPRFAYYSVSVAEGTTNLDARADPWRRLTPPTDRQVLDGRLATWNVANAPEGEYTLRLVTTLRDSSVIEDRRRLILDRTAPQITVRRLESAWQGGTSGLAADLATDDPTRIRMEVQYRGTDDELQGEFETTRHGLFWEDASGTGGRVAVRIAATNGAGLQTVLDTTVSIPPRRLNTALLSRSETRVPAGRLLPYTTDFDGDGLRELVLNQRARGGISDTLRSFEWRGDGFAPADTLIANVIPRDVGDTNGNGRLELLTQVAAVSLLLEQGTPTAFPVEQAFVDTTGLRNPSDENALIGTLLTDVDQDGQGEILGNNQAQWRVLEWNGTDYTEILRLDNPTSGETIDSLQNANRFGTAAALEGDFDADGRTDLLVGDRDGDWMIYESSGPDAMRVAWTFGTARVDAGDRFASGDVDGDGVEEFITYTTFYPLPLDDNALEPAISDYYIWDATGDDTYAPVFRLPVAGETLRGAIQTADVDADGRDEVILSHPPSLYVLDDPSGAGDGWHVAYHSDGGSAPIQSRSLVAEDVDGNGTPEVLAATASDQLVRYDVNAQAAAVPPPQWVAARPADATTVRLRWRAPGTDSVQVFAGAPGAELDRVAGQADSLLLRTTAASERYALRAWTNGTASPLSETRVVRPHAPATVTETTVPTASSIRLVFTEPLAPGTRAEQFALSPIGGASEQVPNVAVLQPSARAVILRFERPVRSGVLQWRGVRDADGLAVAQTRVDVTSPEAANATLIVEAATILGPQRVRLDFNAPLNPSVAEQTSNYRLSPRGRVEEATVDATSPSVVTLTVRDLVIGATGQRASLTVTNMETADGAVLADAGRAISLTQPADDLANVFIYPNPYRAREHDERLTIAGLPLAATIRIYSPDGRLVRVLETRQNARGGATWDLRDRRGQAVPAGVYLIRVETDEDGSVLRKAALIR